MATKKATPAKENDKSAQQRIEGAVTVVAALSQMVEASKPALDWAKSLRAERGESGIQSKLLSRIGQGGLERRAAAIRTGIDLALAPDDAIGRAQLMQEVDRLDHALKVAATLPLVKRKQAHSRIDHELDALEVGLVDALLPKP